MRYDVFLLPFFFSNVFLQRQAERLITGIPSRTDGREKPTEMEQNFQMGGTGSLADIFMNLNISRTKRNVLESDSHTIEKRKGLKDRKGTRRAKQLRRERFLMKQLRNAKRKKAGSSRAKEKRKRQSQIREPKSLEVSAEDTQNALLAAVDDLPKRSATVEISVKDPGMCKVDGEPMCKHGGECNSRDEGGAPVFFCACPPAWGGDFCQQYHDPCSQGLPDCGSMFRCRRDETNPLAGFTCQCHERLGWVPISVADPRCQRITNCDEGNPCRNGGTCHQEAGGFVCVCAPNTSGDLCEAVETGSRVAAGGSALDPAQTALIISQPRPELRPYRQSAFAHSSDDQLYHRGVYPSIAEYQQYRGYPEPGGAAVDARIERRRRWHSEPRYRSSRHRRQQVQQRRHHQGRHSTFLERLLKDVDPQIRRTARDSVIELPAR